MNDYGMEEYSCNVTPKTGLYIGLKTVQSRGH